MESKQPINPFNHPLSDTTPTVPAGAKSAPTASAAITDTSSADAPTNSPNHNQENNADKSTQSSNFSSPSRRSWLLFGITCFLLMLLYIYNSGHANKGLRTKEKLSKELKELNSESISLESQITNASTQSALTQRLQGTGLKEITTPPIKLVKKKQAE
ncbi:MAG: FtsL-like putative cell division protein, partial [Bacteroidota bacterium]|jgi:hypothetical protein